MQESEKYLSDDGQDTLPAELWLEQPQARVAFTPREGLCCTAFRVRHGEDWLSILREPPSWEVLHARPAFYGNPLLFPYAYGVPGQDLVYNGRHYTLRKNREGQYSHGLVRDHRWTVQDQWADAQGAHFRALIEVGGGTPDADDLLAEWPFPFRLTVTCTLSGTALSTRFEVVNRGDGPMPMGLGIHPYFALPLPGSQEQDYLLQTNAPYLGTVHGYRPPTDPAPVGALDLQAGQRLDAYLRDACPAGQMLMGLYGLPVSAEAADGGELGGARWTLTDTRRGFAIDIQSSGDFRFALNFVPPARTVISPVVSTCAPNFWRMATEGRPGGLIELPPAATWTARTDITVRLVC